MAFLPGAASRLGGSCYDDCAPCLSAQMGDNQIAVVQPTGVDLYNQALTDDQAMSIRCRGDNEHTPCVIEPVPYTMKMRCSCEGGGKGPLVQMDKSATLATNNDQYLFQPTTYDARGNGDGKTVNTLTGDHNNRITDYTSVVCLQGNGIDRADTAGCNGKGWREDASYTLNTIGRPAVAYAVDQGGGKSSANVTENKSPTLCTTHGGEPAVAFCVADHPTPKVDEKGVGLTLNARDYKAPLVTAYQDKVGSLCLSNYKGAGNQYISDNKAIVERLDNPPRYIVRRLTPTECARLQGFADCWGHVGKKDSLTDEEYSFWLEVRNTHAAINGKKVQDYTEKQMLTWYNKLWTDSAEYKMWGNGIALPPALYCLQGIVDVLNKKEEDDEWML